MAVTGDLRWLLNGLTMSALLLAASAPGGQPGDRIRQYAIGSDRLVARMNRLISRLLDSPRPRRR
jgi:hypothetical protein